METGVEKRAGEVQVPPARSCSGPLHGLRVLDLAGRPGALCGRLLADAGADVIKIEPPLGDPLRREAPFKDDVPGDERSLGFLHWNANKRGVTLNLERPAGRSLLHQLVKSADAVIETLPQEERGRLGLEYQELQRQNPRLVHVSISSFGESGPYRAYAGNDFVCFALGGLMSLSGEPNKAPLVAPGELAYALASSYAAFGASVALYNSMTCSLGQHVEVSVHEASAFIAGYAVPIFTATGEKPFRQSWQKRLFDLYDVYPTKDGFARIFVVPKNHWHALLEWLGRPPELTADIFDDQKMRWQNSEVIDPHIERLTRGYTKEELFHEAQRRHIAASPVNTPREFAMSVQAKARDIFSTVVHPSAGPVVQMRPIHRYGAFPAPSLRPAPTLGQHNAEVYESLARLTERDLRRLKVDGVI